MSPIALEKENHERDAAFNKAMHGTSATADGGFAAMFRKDKAAHAAAVENYFKHWDEKHAEDETDAIRADRRAEYATLTRQYALPTPKLQTYISN